MEHHRLQVVFITCHNKVMPRPSNEMIRGKGPEGWNTPMPGRQVSCDFFLDDNQVRLLPADFAHDWKREVVALPGQS